MVDWTDPEFLQALLISILGISISVWWLSTRILSKIEEIEERKSKKKSEGPPKSE
tara:strand:- start:3808 stop:3972 length:165 start_codon:yes stop_codon:yes gene_type:complete